MSLKVENCRPIYVLLPSNNITLQEIRTLLPEAIEIISNYGLNTSFNGAYMYVVLMPYKFTVPSAPVFGDRLECSVDFAGLQYSVPAGTQVLAQHVSYIVDYMH